VAAGRYYLDTSAYLCILLGEAGWERITHQIESGHLLSSVLLALEAERTLVQLSRGGRLSPQDLQAAHVGADERQHRAVVVYHEHVRAFGLHFGI
jgi:PIN domain nuclease of toxin-antitoxin system